MGGNGHHPTQFRVLMSRAVISVAYTKVLGSLILGHPPGTMSSGGRYTSDPHELCMRVYHWDLG